MHISSRDGKEYISNTAVKIGVVTSLKSSTAIFQDPSNFTPAKQGKLMVFWWESSPCMVFIGGTNLCSLPQDAVPLWVFHFKIVVQLDSIGLLYYNGLPGSGSQRGDLFQLSLRNWRSSPPVTWTRAKIWLFTWWVDLQWYSQTQEIGLDSKSSSNASWKVWVFPFLLPVPPVNDHRRFWRKQDKCCH